MHRYFLEIGYKGAGYAGFQIQDNAVTIQSEVQRALQIYFKQSFALTGSSRTDSDVNAKQNFFHFDSDLIIQPAQLYHLNAILPESIALNGIYKVGNDQHCRFDALERSYEYRLYDKKNPFLKDRAYFYPFTLDLEKLQKAATLLKSYTDFSSFSKRNTQVKNFNCTISTSEWLVTDDTLTYKVTANRFLRGMVRGLTGTMLKVGRGKLTLSEFEQIILAKNCARADFSVPGHGLFLMQVHYPDNLFKDHH